MGAKIQNSVDSIMINKPLCWVMLAEHGEGFHQQYLANQSDQCFNLHGTMRDTKPEGYNVWIQNETYDVPCTPPNGTTYTTTDPPCTWRATGNCTWNGPREPWRDDDDCNAAIPSCKGTSGWCDCNGNNITDDWEAKFDCDCAPPVGQVQDPDTKVFCQKKCGDCIIVNQSVDTQSGTN